MHDVTDDFDERVLDDAFVCFCDEPEPYRWLYYAKLDDAFDAVNAAEVLGMAWRLRPAWVEEDGPEQQWVVELLIEATLPLVATGSISRDVE